VALSENVRCPLVPICDLLIERRRISTTGASEYKLNKRTVTYTTYNEALIKNNILVKAKNFLVFQGDVEAVASQSSKELTRLVEQISGSLELAVEYERAKEEQDHATENATHNFTKRRAIAGEIKQYKEQKGEAERFEALCQERVRWHELVSWSILTCIIRRMTLYSTVSFSNCSASRKASRETQKRSRLWELLSLVCVKRRRVGTKT
jgi:chromosome segregation ATPase